jgi:hypothetical protein
MISIPPCVQPAQRGGAGRQVAGPVAAFLATLVGGIVLGHSVAGTGTAVGRIAQATATPAPAVGPFPAMPNPVHLPILNFEDDYEACQSQIAVQNIGDEAGKAILIVWGDSTVCAPTCAGPLAVSCSALVRPGAAWSFEPGAIPVGAKSAVVYSFNARSLRDIGEGRTGDDLVADVICGALRSALPGECDHYTSLRNAYNTGDVFAGIPLSRAYGPAITAEVRRTCRGDVNKVVTAASSYTGVAGSNFGGFDRVFHVSSYHATFVYGDRTGTHTVLYVQNGGDRCASVALWLQSQDECRRSSLCRTLMLAQGVSATVDVADCAGPDWSGNVWINSTEPLAIAVDVIGHDGLMTYTAVPADLRYAFDQPPLFTEGSPVAYAPLVLNPAEGWDTRIHVQNLSSEVTAWVRVSFLDGKGARVGSVQSGRLCPRGDGTFALTAVTGSTTWHAGTARVESWQGTDAQGMPGPPPNISAVAEITHRPGPSGQPSPDRVAYNLLSEKQTFDWPSGHDGPGIESGAAVLAIPNLSNAADQSGARTEIAVANVVPQPGATNVAVLLFDQNGVVGVQCRQLQQLEVAYLHLGEWRHVSPDFIGSAIISATTWRHPVYDLRGQVVRSLVGLAAAVVQFDAPSGDGSADLAGDESSATTGVAVRDVGRHFAATLTAAAGGAPCPPLPSAIPTATPDPVRPIYLPRVVTR